MAALALTSLLTGYFWIVGGNYCYYPNLIFITGAVAGDHMAWYFVTFAPNADTEGVRGMVIA
ncbi:hypothetical protein KIN20_001703 [Parelaphostrongylus tenuis]|uniref:Uncharacterized protein n=1 Tax=Parelaphostrongylus tenuis TaxID=148309 RepID=A0AAD5MFE6_PARTN|nr:hypothetical protein KIN20_001703 [Parelaphostrongylus tenuis]